ncbi:hypothetical protein CHARACLAT_001470, partial [Characodon lateralis]|nr:hypothetical protein [Characodon lateralis]
IPAECASLLRQTAVMKRRIMGSDLCFSHEEELSGAEWIFHRCTSTLIVHTPFLSSVLMIAAAQTQIWLPDHDPLMPLCVCRDNEHSCIPAPESCMQLMDSLPD